MAQGEQSQDNRPTFRERIENHPLIVLIFASVAVATTTFAVAQRLVSGEYKNEIDKHKSDIAKLEETLRTKFTNESINRTPYDVTRFIASDSNINELSENSESFGRFYALKDDPNWRLEERATTYLQNYLHGTENPYNIHVTNPSSKKTKYMIHLWKGLDEITDNDRPFYKKIFPFISLQYVPENELKNIREESYGGNINQFGLLIKPEWLVAIEYYFKNDATGFFLGGIMQSRLLFQMFNPSVEKYLTNVVKVKNVKGRKVDFMYFREVTSTGPVKTNGRSYDNYYITEEDFWFVTSNDAYVVSTHVPSPERYQLRQPYFKWVDHWLNNFRIVAKE